MTSPMEQDFDPLEWVKLLRDEASLQSNTGQPVRAELLRRTADAIEEQAQEIAWLRDALKPFAETAARHDHPGMADLDDDQPESYHVRLGAWRKARRMVNMTKADARQALDHMIERCAREADRWNAPRIAVAIRNLAVRP